MQLNGERIVFSIDDASYINTWKIINVNTVIIPYAKKVDYRHKCKTQKTNKLLEVTGKKNALRFIYNTRSTMKKNKRKLEPHWNKKTFALSKTLLREWKDKSHTRRKYLKKHIW